MSEFRILCETQEGALEIVDNTIQLDAGDQALDVWAFEVPEGKTKPIDHCAVDWSNQAAATEMFPQDLIGNVSGGGRLALNLADVECDTVVQIDVTTPGVDIGDDNTLDYKEAQKAAEQGQVVDGIFVIKECEGEVSIVTTTTNPVAEIEQPPKDSESNLPNTGSEALELTVIGSVALAAGAAVLWFKSMSKSS